MHMTEDANDAHIVHTAIDLAHGLHLHVVAEGVETAEHLSPGWPRATAATPVQGCLPRPAAAGTPSSTARLAAQHPIDTERPLDCRRVD